MSPMHARRQMDERTVSSGSQGKSLSSPINNLIDIIDACIDRISTRVNAMPYLLRYFCKFIYEESKNAFPKDSEEK